MYKHLSAPLLCQIELTSVCNHKCTHCYNFWRNKSSYHHDTTLRKDDIDIIIKKLAEAKVFDIIITGGEPLMKFDELVYCLSAIRDAGIGVGLNSNLIPINMKKAKVLRSLGVKSVLTSLTASTATKHDKTVASGGAFARLVRNIPIVIDSDINVAVNMVVTRKNINDIFATAQLAKSLGVHAFSATKAQCPGSCSDFSHLALRPGEEFKKHLEVLRDVRDKLDMKVDTLEVYPMCAMKGVLDMHSFRRCNAGLSTFTIGSDGNVRPCSSLDMSYGNLIVEELSTIWDKMRPWRTGIYIPNTCKKCKLFTLCSGGCRMEAKMSTGGELCAMDPYATKSDISEILLKYVALQKTRSAPKRVLKPRSKFKVNNFKLRMEKFGGILRSGRMSYVLLDTDGFAAVKQLSKNVVYNIDDMQAYCGSLNAASFVATLEEKGVVEVLGHKT